MVSSPQAAHASYISAEVCHKFRAWTVGRAQSWRMLRRVASFQMRATLWVAKVGKSGRGSPEQSKPAEGKKHVPSSSVAAIS